MREMFLGAVTHGATKGTTPTVFEHRRRHLLSAGSIPSPMEAVRILRAEPASSHFLADGVAATAHHAARSITPPQTSCGLLPNKVSSPMVVSPDGASLRRRMARWHSRRQSVVTG